MLANNEGSTSYNQDEGLIEERRKFVRLNINVNIDYSILAKGNEEQAAQSKNISAGGICLITTEKLQRGDILKLTVTLPDDPPDIAVQGRVAWVKEFSLEEKKYSSFDTGIEFIQMSDEDRNRINKYVFSLK